MAISARTLHTWPALPRLAVGEHVDRCKVCSELTPHARVIRRRLSLVIAALALDAAALIVDWNQLVLFAASFAFMAAWVVLRVRDRRRPAQCLRCLDRPRPEPGFYLIDLF